MITHKVRGAAAVKVRWHYLQRKAESNKKRVEPNGQQPKMFFIVNPGNNGVAGYPQGVAGDPNSVMAYPNMMNIPEGAIPPGAVVYFCGPNGGLEGIPMSAMGPQMGQLTQDKIPTFKPSTELSGNNPGIMVYNA